MIKPSRTFPTVEQAQAERKQDPTGWGGFLHWVYCPDGPGPCKCDPKK